MVVAAGNLWGLEWWAQVFTCELKESKQELAFSRVTDMPWLRGEDFSVEHILHAQRHYKCFSAAFLIYVR